MKHRTLWRSIEVLALVVLVAWGVAVRASYMDDSLMWIDEGESSINALGILEHGVPVDHYLGLPIYENAVTIPWPEHPEYEFRDSSYSDRGVAIYHGWLPLYSIALSFELFGIEPDVVPESLMVQHDDEAIRMRTIAGRLPGVVFGGLYILALYGAGRAMFGRDAGWAAAIVGAFLWAGVHRAPQARYYSALLLMSVVCCWMIWNMARHGRWRDFILAALALLAMFHTHMVTFAVACVTAMATLPWVVRHPRWLAKLSVAALVGAVGTLPWLILTGFFEHSAQIPRAWGYLRFPEDLLVIHLERPHVTWIVSAGLTVIITVWLLRSRFPRVWFLLAGRAALPVAMLLVWVVATCLAWIFLMPAVSLSYERMTLSMLGPGMLLLAVLFALAARMAFRRYSMLAAPVALALYTIFFGGLVIRPGDTTYGYSWEFSDEIIAALRELDLPPDTRLYSTPSHQLQLQFYTGLPIQSVVPVRRSFFDAYPGPIVLIDGAPAYRFPSLPVLREVASSMGQSWSDQELQIIGETLAREAVIESLEASGVLVRRLGDMPSLPPGWEAHLDLPQTYGSDYLNHALQNDYRAVFRGQPMEDWSDMWPVFFYRFVDPQARVGERANYAGRIAGQTALVGHSGWAIYISPALNASEPGTMKDPNSEEITVAGATGYATGDTSLMVD